MKKLWYKKKSSLHGSGLFSSCDIKKGEQIIEYIGDKVTKKEGDKRADKQIKKAEKNKKNGMVYVFELNKKYDIDGGVGRNYARFINHSCDPNCEVEITNNHIWISSIKKIKKGVIHSINLKTLEYAPMNKKKYPGVRMAKEYSNLNDRI